MFGNLDVDLAGGNVFFRQNPEETFGIIVAQEFREG